MIKKDKLLHLGVGAIIALIGSLMGGWVFGLLLSAMAGALKEYRDSKGYGCVELMDFIATVVGGIGGVCVWILIKKLIME